MRRRRRLAPVLARVALAGLAVLAAPAPGAAARSEADRLWLVGVGAFEDGLYETAYRELGRFVQAAPTDRRRGDAALLRGKAAFSMERYAEALTEFDAAEAFPLTVATTPGEATFWQGEALFRLRRWEEARDRYARFLGLKPASPYVPEALYARGQAELEAGRADGAVDTFRDFLRDYPSHVAGADGRLQRGARADPGQALGGRPCPPRPVRGPGIPEAPISRRRAIFSGSPRWRRAGRRACGRSSSSSRSRRAASSPPRPACSSPRPRRRPGRNREALEQYQALVRASPTHALAPQALYRIGELSVRLNRPADAEAAWTTLRRDFPQNALVGPAGLATARLHEQRKHWEPAIQVAQSVADLRGEERSAALLVVGQSALQLRRSAEAAQAYHAVVVESPPASKRYFEGLAGLAAALEAGTDKEGAKRAYREIVDTSQDPELVRWAKGRLAAFDAPAAAAAGGSAPRSQAQAQGTREVMRGFR